MKEDEELAKCWSNGGHRLRRWPNVRPTSDHYEGGRHIPASTRNWPNVGLMLGHRLRRWPNVRPTSDHYEGGRHIPASTRN